MFLTHRLPQFSKAVLRASKCVEKNTGYAEK